MLAGATRVKASVYKTVTDQAIVCSLQRGLSFAVA